MAGNEGRSNRAKPHLLIQPVHRGLKQFLLIYIVRYDNARKVKQSRGFPFLIIFLSPIICRKSGRIIKPGWLSPPPSVTFNNFNIGISRSLLTTLSDIHTLEQKSISISNETFFEKARYRISTRMHFGDG